MAKHYIVLNNNKQAFSLNGWQNDHAKALVRKTEVSARKMLDHAANFIEPGQAVDLYSDYGSGFCKLVDTKLAL